MLRRALLLSLFIGLVACGPSAKAPEPKQDAAVAEAIVITTSKVERTEVAVPITGSGNITPVRLTDIGPSVDGIIEEVMVAVGDTVKKGQPLFRTRDVDIRLQVQEMERQVTLARAQSANAQADLRRQNALKSGGWVSASKLDAMRTNAEVTRAQAGVWEARLAQLKQNLADTVVRAPYNGVITRKDVYEGRFMATRFGGGAGGAAGVVQIMDIDTVAAIVNVPEIYVAQIKLGMPAKIRVDGFEKPFDAEVLVINHRVDHQTRSMEIRLAIPNKDHKILPGLFCNVELTPEARKVLVADRKFVLGGEGARYAYVAENGRAKKFTLSTRDLDGERVEILSNVPEGTQLIGGVNIARLTDGIAVKPEAPPARTAASN